MNVQTTPSPAELADRTAQLLAASMFTVALVFCLSVAEYLASESAAPIIVFAVKALGIAILGSMALLYFWKFRSMSTVQLRESLAEDGFLQSGFRKPWPNHGC